MAAKAQAAEHDRKNSAETRDVDRADDGRFVPGNRANASGKGGRPRGRGIARRVRDAIGEDGDSLVGFWGMVLSGQIRTVRAVVDKATGEVKEETIYEEVSVADRIAVSKLLAERGWGKPPQFAPIEDEDPLERGLDPKQLAEGFEDELAARRRRLRDRPAA
jgi:hypothetical protein